MNVYKLCEYFFNAVCGLTLIKDKSLFSPTPEIEKLPGFIPCVLIAVNLIQSNTKIVVSDEKSNTVTSCLRAGISSTKFLQIPPNSIKDLKKDIIAAKLCIYKYISEKRLWIDLEKYLYDAELCKLFYIKQKTPTVCFTSTFSLNCTVLRDSFGNFAQI
jgi:hypothetical protein